MSVAVGGRQSAVEMGTVEMAMSRVAAVARVAGPRLEKALGVGEAIGIRLAPRR